MEKLFIPNGYCFISGSTEKNMHYFGLFDSQGNKIMECPFANMDAAINAAKIEFPDDTCDIRDLTCEWYKSIAIRYRKRIKNLRKSFKTSNIILELDKMFYSRNPNDWYTFIPFSYEGGKWYYRETADGKEWLER